MNYSSWLWTVRFFPEEVIWYSVKSPEAFVKGIDHPQSLTALQAEIDWAVLGLGLEEADYVYNPHIPLAKVKNEARAVEAPIWTWRVEELEIRQIVSGGENRLIPEITSWNILGLIELGMLS